MNDTKKKLEAYEAMEQRLNKNLHLENEVQHLINSGLMRLDAEGTAHHVGSWEEHQQLAAAMQQDQQVAQQMQQQ